MNKHNLKSCTIIYNPVATGFKKDDILKIEKAINEKGIKTDLCKSTSQGVVPNIIKSHNTMDNLILTIGGDGTVSEAYKAFNEVNQNGVYAHIPTGTTNDMAKNYDVRHKDKLLIINDILNGEQCYMDSFKVNDNIACYTSVFGYLAHVPYVTNSKVKKIFHHSGYVLTAIPELFKAPTKYNIDYETDNIKDNTPCILGAVSNSKGFAGINLYKDVDLSDGKIELLLFKKADPKLILSLFKDYIKNDIDLKKYQDYIISDSSSKIKLTFNETYPKMAFDNDGEKSSVLPNEENNEVTFEVGKKIRVLKSKIR